MGLRPEGAKALPEVIKAIDEADLIILGPGSLYTSIIPNLLVDGVSEAIRRSQGLKIYILNIMTQDGETEGYSASDHLKALMSHGGKADVCLYNTDRVARRLLEKYAGESARQLWPDPREFRQMGVELTGESILSRDAHFVRHDPLRLAYAVMKTAARLAPRPVSYTHLEPAGGGPDPGGLYEPGIPGVYHPGYCGSRAGRRHEEHYGFGCGHQ